MTMDELKPKQSAYIRSVGGTGALRHHLLDMGLTPKTEVTLQKIAPMGDPVQIELRGYELTLRLDEAQKITVEKVHTKAEKMHGTQRIAAIEHPGVGELGRAKNYHVHDAANEIPERAKITFALVGNQNCGKTTLFNQLTGANQHVGNFPGVTVDRKDGIIRKHSEAVVTDLPGIYSLSPYSSEEIVTRDFLMDTHPDGIINIVDATNMERNLYLTMQLMELGIPMVLALNMMDEVRANGGSVRVNELEEILGIPVVPISAAKNEGIEELIDHAIHVARHRESPGRVDFCPASSDEHDPVGAVHRCIHAAVHILEPEAKKKGMPVRFAVTKMVENDRLMKEKLSISSEKADIFEHLLSVLETETGLDREAALANMRFSFIGALCAKTVVRPHESREHKRSMATDRILTGKYTAIPCFIGIMALVFVMTFSFTPGHYLAQTGLITNKRLMGSGKWQTWTVSKILADEVYMGDMVQGKSKTVGHKQVPTDRSEWIVVRGTHEPLIARELYERVQAVRERAAAKQGTEKIPYTENILRGRIFCGCCGKNLHRQRSRGIYSYRCIANDRMGVQYCPGGVTHLPEKRLFDALLAIIRKHAEVVVGTHTKLKQQDYKITAKKAEMIAEISKLQQETERNRVFLTSLYENFVTGILTGTEYHEMKAGYTQKIETAVLRVQQLQSKQKALENQMERYTDIAKRLAAVSEDTALSALLVNQLIDCVTVNSAEDIHVKFKFESGFERLMEVLEDV